MEKIKHVLSSGSHKRHDSAAHDQGSGAPITGVKGEGSHLATANEHHPIYDEFAGKRSELASGEPIKTTDNAPHFSNTPTIHKFSADTEKAIGDSPAPAGTTSLSSTLSPPPLKHHTQSEQPSNASIKSGVIGNPQGKTSASEEKKSAFSEDFNNAHASAPEDVKELPGATAMTGTSELPIRQKESERYDFKDPEIVTDTNREFPLAGGVTKRKDATTDSTSHDATTTILDPITSDTTNQPSVLDRTKGALAAGVAAGASILPGRGNGAHDSHDTAEPASSPNIGREVSSTEPIPPIKDNAASSTSHDQTAALLDPIASRTTNQPTVLDRTKGALAAGVAAGASMLPGRGTDTAEPVSSAETNREVTSTEPIPPIKDNAASSTSHDQTAALLDPIASGTKQSTQPSLLERTKGALAAGVAAGASLLPGHGKESESPTHADTSTVSDSNRAKVEKLHIPGEFPSPTPTDEPNKQLHAPGSTMSGTGIAPPRDASGPQNTQIPKPVEPYTHAQPRTDEPAPAHHYGRDAAIAGGVGAAGLGSYHAGKHHQKESTGIEDTPIPVDPSPYSSSALDPRVGLDEKTASKKQPRASLSSASSGHVSFAGSGPVGPLQAQKEVSHDRTATQAAQHALKPKDTHEKEPESEHHYGRNAGLAGAGAAAAAGGVYASQHKDKQDTGPASSTIGPHKSNMANILDPRVKPDPELQKHHTAGPTPEDPATHTVGPHKSNIANILDPKVKPEPEKMKGQTSTGPHKSDTLNRLDPRVDAHADQEDGHHTGRDAAFAGGAAATGYGANDVPEKSAHRRASQHTAPLDDQRFDPSAKGSERSGPAQHHYGRDAGLLTGAGALGYGAYQASKPEDSAYNAPQLSEKHASEAQAIPQSTQQPYGQRESQPSGLHYQQSGQQSFEQPPHQPREEHAQPQPPHEDQHHHGRDAAFVGGAGALGYGAYKASHPDERSNLPQSQPETLHAQSLAQQPQHNQAPQSQPLAQQSHHDQPQQAQSAGHHYGRDAAVVGGAGTAGYGAYKAFRPEDHSYEASQPVVGQQQVPLQSQQQQYHSAAPHQETQQTQPTQHHYGRDAALAGGAGAAGYGVYKAAHGGDDSHAITQPPARPQQIQQPAHQSLPSASQPMHPMSQPAAQQQPMNQFHQGTAVDPKDKSDHKRDAAFAGAAGVVGAGAAYEYSQHEAENAEKERLNQQKEWEKQQLKEQKELEKQQKHEQKELEKQQKHDAKVAEKEQEKAEKHEAKVAAAEEKKHQKEIEKQHKHEQKEAEKAKHKEEKHAAMIAAAEEEKRHHELEEQQRRQHELEEQQRRQYELEAQQQREIDEEKRKQEEEAAAGKKEKKKHHHILPFLHRHKDDKGKATESRNSSSASDTPLQSHEYLPGAENTDPSTTDRSLTSETEASSSAVGGTGQQRTVGHIPSDSTGRASMESTGSHKSGRNRLHKDPPPGHPAREAMEAAKYQQLGPKDPIGAVAGDQTLHSGVYEVHPRQNEYTTPNHPGGNGTGGV